MRSVVRVHLSPLARAFELNKNPNGGVAQLGEHLPCKQGVKSSNLSVSIQAYFTSVSISDACIQKYECAVKFIWIDLRTSDEIASAESIQNA